MGAHINPSGTASTDPGQVIIQFDDCQLLFRSDVPDALEYMAQAFGHMIADRVTNSIGELEFIHIPNGYSIRGSSETDYPAVALADLLPLLKDEVRLRFMRARPDLLWMHAGAVERSGVALLLSGPSGHGKSTLTTLLCERGWRLMSDDIAPVRMDVDEVLPFPQSPLRRIHPGHEVDPLQVSYLDREPVSVATEMLRRGAAPIGALVFIEYKGGVPAGLVKIPRGSAAMEMLRNATNFVDHKGAAVGRVAALARRVPAYRLLYGRGADAVALVDALW